MRARKTPESPYSKDPHYYDCPDCGPQGSMGSFGRDIRGRPVYECSKCGRKCGGSTLDQFAKARRMRD